MVNQTPQNEESNLEQILLEEFHGNAPIIDNNITSIPTLSAECLEYFKDMFTVGTIRIAIEGGGCSGFRYEFYCEEEIDNSIPYFIINTDPLVIIDDESIKYMKGSIIQVEANEIGYRVYIDNPGAKQGCGCGESFTYEL
jgi:iron-sulfur cluster assembly accessory protein